MSPVLTTITTTTWPTFRPSPLAYISTVVNNRPGAAPGHGVSPSPVLWPRARYRATQSPDAASARWRHRGDDPARPHPLSRPMQQAIQQDHLGDRQGALRVPGCRGGTQTTFHRHLASLRTAGSRTACRRAAQRDGGDKSEWPTSPTTRRHATANGTLPNTIQLRGREATNLSHPRLLVRSISSVRGGPVVEPSPRRQRLNEIAVALKQHGSSSHIRCEFEITSHHGARSLDDRSSRKC